MYTQISGRKNEKGQSAGILWAIFSLTLTIEDFKGFLYKFNSSPKQKKNWNRNLAQGENTPFTDTFDLNLD